MTTIMQHNVSSYKPSPQTLNSHKTLLAATNLAQWVTVPEPPAGYHLLWRCIWAGWGVGTWTALAALMVTSLPQPSGLLCLHTFLFSVQTVNTRARCMSRTGCLIPQKAPFSIFQQIFAHGSASILQNQNEKKKGFCQICLKHSLHISWYLNTNEFRLNFMMKTRSFKMITALLLLQLMDS